MASNGGRCLINKLRVCTQLLERKYSSSVLLASDGRAIVCVHPLQQVPVESTKAIGGEGLLRESRSQRLPRKHVEMVRALRSEDPSLWTLATLAKLFQVEKCEVGRVAPITPERKAQLAEEKRLLSQMRSHQRKIYHAEQEMIRRKKLESALAKRMTDFPLYQQQQPKQSMSTNKEG